MTDLREQVEAQKHPESKVQSTVNKPRKRSQEPKLCTNLSAEGSSDSENTGPSKVQQKSHKTQSEGSVSRISSRTRAQLKLAAHKVPEKK